MMLSAIAWIVLGLLVGHFASTSVDSRGEGRPFHMLLGMVGAVIGGWIFRNAGDVGVTGFNIWSLTAAVMGAAVFLAAWHAIRRATRAQITPGRFK